MVKEKQQVDIEVLGKVIEVKNLERTLREDNPFYQDPENLRNLGSGELNDEENERFVEGYSDFVNSYVKDVISGRLQAIYDENAEVFDGTPEGRYIQDLINGFSGTVNIEAIYDTKLGDLNLSVRAHDCLENDRIKYIGQLVKRTENEMLRIPNFGRKSLNELKEILGGYGLSFGMDINYILPEERSNGDK